MKRPCLPGRGRDRPGEGARILRGLIRARSERQLLRAADGTSQWVRRRPGRGVLPRRGVRPRRRISALTVGWDLNCCTPRRGLSSASGDHRANASLHERPHAAAKAATPARLSRRVLGGPSPWTEGRRVERGWGRIRNRGSQLGGLSRPKARRKWRSGFRQGAFTARYIPDLRPREIGQLPKIIAVSSLQCPRPKRALRRFQGIRQFRNRIASWRDGTGLEDGVAMRFRPFREPP
jgi:hypothetical protein